MYNKKRMSAYRLSIVIWPVACYNSSHFLSKILVLRYPLDRLLTDNYSEDLYLVIKTLASLDPRRE